MIFVGSFNEKQLRSGDDKKVVADKMKETGLSYVKTQIVNKGGKPVALKIWLMSNEEYFATSEI